MKSLLSLSKGVTFKTFDIKKNAYVLLWFLIAIFCIIQSLITHRYNNYLIFENTVRNLFHQQSLYAQYPKYHFDSNHYGPMFGVFFIPFSVFPNWLGLFFWNLFNCWILVKAIETLKLENKGLFFAMGLSCFASASLSDQFNPATGAFIILSFSLLNKDKGLWSTLLIALGTFIKLYGIVGLAFFFFVKDKKRFIIYLLMWSLLFFVLPMLFSSPDYIIATYKEWFLSLEEKNKMNIIASSQNVAILGFIRNILPQMNISNLTFLSIGLLVFSIPYLNFKAYHSEIFQLYILASTLLFVVLYSSGSEDCTYIIAVNGVSIWYLLTKPSKGKLIFALIVGVLSCNLPLLLFHEFSLQYPFLLSSMCIPFFMVWLFVVYNASRIKGDAKTAVL